MVIAAVPNPIDVDSPIYTHVGRALHYGITRRGFQPRLVVWHTTESPDATMAGSLRYNARRPDQVSCTAFAGQEGLGQDTPELGRPYTQSRWNDEALALEIIGSASWAASYWQDARQTTLDNIVIMTADWCRRWGIPARWLTPQELLDGVPGVCDHLMCNAAAILEVPSRKGKSGYTHTDAGQGIRYLSAELLAKVNALLEPPFPPPTPPEEDPLRILVLNDAGGAAVLLSGFTGRWLDPARYNAFHYFNPELVDEPAAKSWLANVTMLGALPPGVSVGDVWGHQPDS